MSSVDKAFETQLKNIQTKTGKTLEQLYVIIKKSGLAKHGEIRDMLKKNLDMGHGDANTVVHFYMKSTEPASAQAKSDSPDAAIDTIYSGAKAHFRPIHDKLMAAINKFGEFDIAPKKTYVSLRRKKQFAMIGPATNTRFEVGLNMKGVKATARLNAMPPGGMCQYKVNLTDAKEVDKELIDWIKQAYESAG
jgi:t-SNARE complex subunit (syntaxin)